MSEKKVAKPVALAVGAALAGSFALGSTIATADEVVDSPFSMTTLSAGYLLGEEGSCGGYKEGKGEKEGSCGEGSCGGDKEGKGEKEGEGSCGEGSCGGDKDGEGSCGEEKDAEGACGEGSCGGSI